MQSEFFLPEIIFMIAKSYIESNLKQLDRLYGSAGTQKKELYYSKLAILELCGWLEESMDDVVQKCANRALKEANNRSYVTEKIIKPTYGFEYEKHFKKMLISVVGLVTIEKVESKVDPLVYARFISALGNLKVARNKEAHTHIKGVMRTIDAPSVTLRNFQYVHDGLKAFDSQLRTMGL